MTLRVDADDDRAHHVSAERALTRAQQRRFWEWARGLNRETPAPSFGTVEPASCKAPRMNWYLIVRPTIDGPLQIRPLFWSEQDTAILVLQAFARSDGLGAQLLIWDSGIWRSVQQPVSAPYGFP